MPSIEEIARAATQSVGKKPITGSELAVKVNRRLGTEYDGRGIGRGLGLAVKEGKVVKTGPRIQPVYSKPQSVEA